MRSISLSPPGWVTERPGWTVFVSLALAVLALSRLVDFQTGAAQLLLDPSVNSMLPAADDDSRFYDQVRETFGSDEQMVVALSSPEVFSQESLEAVVAIADQISELEGVRQVRSLKSLLIVAAADSDTQEPEVVIPDDPAELARLREVALANPLLAGNLVSRDARTAALVIEFDDISEQEFFDRGLDLEIERLANAGKGSASVAITGGAHIKAAMTRFLLRDLTLIVPVAVFVIALVAFISFRTVRAVAVLLSTVAISTIWLLAILVEGVGSLNQVTVAVPPILIVVGFAYAVHVLSAYYASLRRGERGPAAARSAIEHVALPVVLTGVTTCAGFASLATSKLEAIQQFGLYTALGVLLTTAASLTYAPALLALLPNPRKLPKESTGQRFDRMVESLARFDVAKRRGILWAFAGVGVLSLLGMMQIQVNTDLVKNFKANTEVRRDFEVVNEALGGANSLSVVLESPYLGAFENAPSLRTIEDLQKWLEGRPEIGGSTSVVDHLQSAFQMAGGEGSVVEHIEGGGRVEALLAAIPAEELRAVVDAPRQTANILVRTSAIDSADVVRLVREIEEHLKELPPTVIPAVTGNTVLMSRTIDEIALGQALSLSTAFVIIFAILVLLFASFRVAIIALIPNALPVLFYFGVLGWTGIDLNTTTGLVAALVLGIAVDDTIHYLAQFNIAAKGHADTRKGVVEALHSVMRPVTYTTAALCLGFSTLMLSQLRNQVEFGALAAGTLAFAWLVDVTLTPALAARMRVVTLWDILTLDIGPQPQRAIPLFEGLRETQARVVALLARPQHIHKGHHLMAHDTAGEGMYIMIDGELEISIPRQDDSVSLQIARRGDTLGEGALFHGRRIADAVALTDARLLLFNEDELAQLRDRYPRIATQVYRNLSRILAVQLAQATGMVSAPPEVEAEQQSAS